MEAWRHLPINFHTCKTCSYRTRFIHKLTQHLRQHRSRSRTDLFICDSYTPEAYECEFCDFQSDLKVNLTHHLQTAHNQSEVRFDIDSCKEHTCKQCPLKTFSLLKLLHHYYAGSCDCKNHLEADETWSYSIEGASISPNITKHGNGWFYCAHCPYKSEKKFNLRRHIRYKHSKNEIISWFYCEHCSHKTKRKDDLNRHIMSKHAEHEDITWFHCEHCLYHSKTKCHLDRHILHKHTKSEDIRWVCCEQCSYKGKSKGDLNLHIINKHTKDEDIIWVHCEDCSYKAKTKKSMHAHVRNKHPIPYAPHF